MDNHDYLQFYCNVSIGSV